MIKNRLNLLYLFVFLIYGMAIFNFFSADDWFHLKVSNVSTLSNFINFFSFNPNINTISFYRPLSTQIFFFTFYKLFGLNVVPYYLFVLIIFGLLIYFIYKLVLKMGFDKNIGYLCAIFYLTSSTNFSRLYFLSAFQEVLMTLFVVSSLLNFLDNKNFRGNMLFVLALLSKETAIVLLPLLIIIDFMKNKIQINRYWIPILITVIYLFFRFGLFGIKTGDSYVWNFSIKSVLNTSMWYGLWSIGLPELLVDYVRSGFKILPKFFIELGWWANMIIIYAILFLSLMGIILFLNKNKIKNSILALSLFFVSLLPVIFLPWHKFTLELALPLIGFCLFLSINLSNKKFKYLNYFIIVVFILFNLAMNVVYYQRNYSKTRASIAKKVNSYFEKNKNLLENNVYFVNNGQGSQWGVSKQIYYALSGRDYFDVKYNYPKIKIYYEDVDKNIDLDNLVKIDSRQFLDLE